jgi:hypothetical protein
MNNDKEGAITKKCDLCGKDKILSEFRLDGYTCISKCQNITGSIGM